MPEIGFEMFMLTVVFALIDIGISYLVMRVKNKLNFKAGTLLVGSVVALMLIGYIFKGTLSEINWDNGEGFGFALSIIIPVGYIYLTIKLLRKFGVIPILIVVGLAVISYFIFGDIAAQIWFIVFSAPILIPVILLLESLMHANTRYIVHYWY